MAAQITTLADALTAAVLAAWNASLVAPATVAAPDEVSREYVADVDLDSLTGRKVYVFSGSDYENGPVTRGEDEWVYRIQAVIVERYAEGAGRPPKAWMDARVEFVQNIVSGTLDYVRELLSVGGREITTQSNTVSVYDTAKFSEHKCFWSEVVFEFRETMNA